MHEQLSCETETLMEKSVYMIVYVQLEMPEEALRI
jgi:hypothetical protein